MNQKTCVLNNYCCGSGGSVTWYMNHELGYGALIANGFSEELWQG
jgi:hypothetical protein